jgi:hypothetical protein
MLSAAVTFGLFFIAGEEISWGQRAFGWETPGSFGDRNWQNETTFHNFTGVHAYFVYGVATIGLYAALAPLLWNAVWSRRRRSPLAYLLVPPAFLVFSFVPAFVYRTIRLAFQPEAHYPSLIGGIVEYAETTELCLYFGFCVFGLLHLRVVNGACRHHPGRRG